MKYTLQQMKLFLFVYFSTLYFYHSQLSVDVIQWYYYSNWYHPISLHLFTYVFIVL